MIKKKKVFEWIHRILAFIIIDSLMSIVFFAGFYISLKVLTEKDLMSFGVSLGLLQAGLGYLYLQIVNIFYWFVGINLLDFKLWRKK